ncbi:MAG: metabolite traffic protein EboE [Planctomycetota bacterium]|nr:metabolite traffic protein EboE [Planctomycetota bacterium]
MAWVVAGGHRFALSYSTNVHPARTVEDVMAFLSGPVAEVRREIFPGGRAAVNLRLSRRMADALSRDETLLRRLDGTLAANGLFVQSINGFPILDFHAERVKEMVYSPPWTDGGRNLATCRLADLLAHWLPEGGAGTVTVPTGIFKGYADGPEILQQCAHFQTETLRHLVDLERKTGRTVRVGFEPEPFTTCERIGEFISYYEDVLLPEARRKLEAERGMSAAAAEDACRRLFGLNADLCHMACEFEDPAEGLGALESAGIRLMSLHASSALEIVRPASSPGAMEALRRFDEPRYLHQVCGADAAGRVILRLPDLPELFAMPAEKLAAVERLRVHFHAPIFFAGDGVIGTTRAGMGKGVRHVISGKQTDTVVIETYTWNVAGAVGSGRGVFGIESGDGFARGIAEEFRWFIRTFGVTVEG